MEMEDFDNVTYGGDNDVSNYGDNDDISDDVDDVDDDGDDVSDDGDDVSDDCGGGVKGKNGDNQHDGDDNVEVEVMKSMVIVMLM